MRDYDTYSVPYAGLVPADPTFDDMHRLVCESRARPPIPQRWAQVTGEDRGDRGGGVEWVMVIAGENW